VQFVLIISCRLCDRLVALDRLKRDLGFGLSRPSVSRVYRSGNLGAARAGIAASIL
jgi:hypothetical protein